jgi:hypothetical protein
MTFITQQERMANLSPKNKKWLAEVDQSGYQIEEYSYYSAKDNRPLINWEEHVKNLDKSTTCLQIKPNEYRFQNNKLTIKQENFPNLTTLYACGLGLEEIELDSPTLQNLYLADNKLERLDLDNTPRLRNLVASKNSIEYFDVNHLSQLRSFVCNKNKPFFTDLNVSGLTKLVYLDCSESKLHSLNMEGCKKLEVLDADMNNLDEECLNFKKLYKLKALSLKFNWN